MIYIKNKDSKLNVKRTWKYIKYAKKNLLGYGLISITESIISIILPLLSAEIILNISNSSIKQLILTAIALFIANIILYIVIYFKSLFYQRIYRKTMVSLQKAIAEEILKLEIQEIEKNTSGLFIDRLNKDTQDMSGLFMEYTYWISYVLANIGILITLFILNKYMFVYATITSIIVYLVDKKRLHKQFEVQKQLKHTQESKTGITSELVRGIKDLKLLNANETILQQVSNKIEETTKKEINIINIKNFYNYLENNIKAFTDLILVILGCYLYENGLLTIPTFIIIYNYQTKIKDLLIGVGKISEYNKSFNLAANRVYELIEDSKFKKEQFGKVEVKELQGNIKFQNITFGYTKIKVLKDMTFEIEANEKIAFVGKSGAGKTTIFNLISKLYKQDKGKILLDKYNIEELSCSSIRKNIALITQNPYIFNLSIKENLLLASENSTMKEIREACRTACIDDYIMSLPNKYETIVGENGTILSGGQKQRLAIARALLMKTKIIMFDEATSALDNETQSQIQQAINNLKEKHTVLIIAHRLSTIIDCDKIFVVNNGKIVDSGTHQELLKRCNYYKDLYNRDLEK